MCAEIGSKRPWLTYLFALAVAFQLAGFLYYIGNGDGTRAVLYGAGFVAFLAAGLQNFIESRPVILSEEGVKFPGGTALPWADVSSLLIARFHPSWVALGFSKRVVAIQVKDVTKANSSLPWTRRWCSARLITQFGTPLILGEANRPLNCEEIAKLIQQFAPITLEYRQDAVPATPTKNFWEN